MIEKVIHGNNIEVLKTFPDNYFDSVVTDPPYGINFMNKKWDYDVPNVETWKEVFRVLKPGGHMLVACGTRTQHRMAVNIEDAGFEIRDIVAWVYGSGFPKSMDISKALDKHLGAEREIIGTKKGSGTTKKDGVETAFVAKNDNDDGTMNITLPSTDEAKQWQGWGTALKPSMELWTLARKPLDGTVAENVLKYGVGGINIDECRVGTDLVEQGRFGRGKAESINYHDGLKPTEKVDDKVGRFPANFIHDGSEEVVKHFPYTKSGKMTSEHERHTDGSPNGIYGKFDENHPLGETYGDEGNASRFFYVPKASQSERNYGLSFMENKTITDGRKKSIDNAFNRGETERKNIHPTVKPIELMRYLIKMITPKQGIVLDLYAGSGSTLIAAKMDKFQYVGIEREKEYIDIINARIKAYVVEYDIFDFL